MRAVVQRCLEGSVVVDGEVVGAIGPGLVVLLAVAPGDGSPEVVWASDKIANLRIFHDDDGKMNRSLVDFGGESLIVSQFTLLGDARKGRRPSFAGAASGPEAERLYEAVVSALRSLGIRCSTGIFGADMKLSLVNDGPVTILLDSEKRF
ncbi:MAG: D-tyrosyl-tRNA(Tyr) deacylase [Actinobacteria bacterium]|nr:D-tyrosyl-tRNA(Tyr) deacylase [Actinomycetota bacterium]